MNDEIKATLVLVRGDINISAGLSGEDRDKVVKGDPILELGTDDGTVILALSTHEGAQKFFRAVDDLRQSYIMSLALSPTQRKDMLDTLSTMLPNGSGKPFRPKRKPTQN